MSESWQLGSRYTLERQIGSGAMGQVWVGHDVDGHTLAFKLLRPELADDPGVVARFLQERNLLVGLRSPYVIRVHDLVVEGPRLAIVMDYIGGPSLRGLLQQRADGDRLGVQRHPAPVAAGEVEQVLDQLGLGLGVPVDDLEALLRHIKEQRGFDFTGYDIALFAIGSEATKQYAPIAAKAGV